MTDFQYHLILAIALLVCTSMKYLESNYTFHLPPSTMTPEGHPRSKSRELHQVHPPPLQVWVQDQTGGQRWQIKDMFTPHPIRQSYVHRYCIFESTGSDYRATH